MVMRKRTEDLQRPRERAGGNPLPVTSGQMREVDWDRWEPDDMWHPIAKMVWESARESGQSEWFQQSDIAMLWSICEDLSLYKLSSRRSAQMLDVLMKTLGNLMMTEGDRRKVRLELQKPEEEEQPLADSAKAAYAELFPELQLATV